MHTHVPVSADRQAGRSVARPTRRVVDAPTRMFHWLFALCFLGAYLTSESERLRQVHGVLGYTMAGLLAFRVMYGLLGPRHARLTGLWGRVAAWPAWLRSTWQTSVRRDLRRVDWRLGQNLMTVTAVLAMLAMVVPLTLSGHALDNDWGGEWLEDLHEMAGEAFLQAVLLHLGLMLALSLWRRVNLALPMLKGRTPGRGPDLVSNDRVPLAWLLAIAAALYWAWEIWRAMFAG